MAIILCAASLAGCVGKNYGFPGFGAKQASKTETDKEVPIEKNASQEKKPSDLNHVASINTDDVATVVPASVSQQGNTPEDSSAGLSHIADISVSSSENVPPEIDQAFQVTQSENSSLQKKQPSQELENYKELVSQVDNGTSSLDALKASLEKLNENNTADSKQVEQADNSFAQYIRSQKQKQSEIIEKPSVTKQIPGIVELTDSEVSGKNNYSLELPWIKSSKTPEADKTSSDNPVEQLSQSGLGHIRGMLTKARGLIQENNLLDARIIAETASALKKKTQGAFLPEEITPEQILAEIAERERQRKKQLLASLDSNSMSNSSNAELNDTSTTQVKQAAPVVIDLSKEWLNSTKNAEGNKLDDIARFDQSIARSNQAARLPTITPAGQHFNEDAAVRSIKTTSYQSIESNSHVEKPTDSASRISQLRAATRNKNETVDQEVTTLEQSSSLPPGLPFVGDLNQAQLAEQTLSDAGSLPILIAPGMNPEEAESQDAEFDQFAADFAAVTTQGNPEIEEAALLIDEAELSGQSAGSTQISTTMISLIVCGMAFGAFMLLRWRR